MLDPLRILILGASYGSLLGTKCAAAGHSVNLVCRPAEAEAINRDGVVVHIPSGRGRPATVHTKTLCGEISAGTPDSFAPDEYDLVGLAMQEPQYLSARVRALLNEIAAARVPCLSIMNMPPLPYLKRIATVDVAALRGSYTDATVWDGFDPALVTLCSPDAQTLRPDAAAPNVLEVRLASNFKAAPFESAVHTNLLRRLERDIDATLFATDDGLVPLPVKLRVSDSLFVPISQWCMLLSGNYRCIRSDGVRSIQAAVYDDIDATRAVYEWVAEVCRRLGAHECDLVPFAKYAAAAWSLTSPSLAARALDNGACHIERADRLVQTIGRQLGMQCDAVDETVALVDCRLARNRANATATRVSLAVPAQRPVPPRPLATAPRLLEPARRETHFAWYGIDEAATPEFVAQWRTLGLAASTPNIYLMPEFLLPAVRYLEVDKAPRFATLWNADRSALLALGVFNAVAPSWRFPYPRLSAVLTKYSLQSGVLLRTGIDAAAVDRFVGGLFEAPCRAVRINEFREDSRVYQQVQDAARRLGLRWFVDKRYERASVNLGNDARWQQHISPSRHARLRRARRKLTELGGVEFRIVQGNDVSDSNAETLLRVEAMGWKGASALLASNERALFFREVTRACSEHGSMLFCEMLVDGHVIASISNFVVNNCGFGFKIGNDPTFAKFSPGYLAQYASLQAFAQACPQLLEIESGSAPGSYVEVLWPERVAIVSGHLVEGQLPAAYATFKQHIKNANGSFAAALRQAVVSTPEESSRNSRR